MIWAIAGAGLLAVVLACMKMASIQSRLEESNGALHQDP